MPWHPQATIHLPALYHNLQQVRRYAPHSRLIAVIKADAYGHGLPTIAQALQHQVAMLAVARLDEALQLRASGISSALLILEGVQDTTELTAAAAANLQLVVHAPHQVQLLHHAQLTQPTPCWLKIDTGMHRLGFPPSHAEQIRQQLQTCPYVQLAGLMTHLANADDPTDASVMAQLHCLATCCPTYTGPRCIANSAGIIAWPTSHADWVRPGLMLYGASPCQDRSAEHIGLRPVMTLSAKLISIQSVRRGDRVGYGGTWQAPQDGKLGIVGIGYGDGYPRQIAPQACVLLNQQRAPIVGRISMDMLAINLHHIPAQIGDSVVLWGEGLPIEEVAHWAQTIPYTLLCGVTQRVPRHYIT